MKKCELCNGYFLTYPSYDRTYCSEECMSLSYKDRFSGKDHPNWQGGKLEKECIECSKNFKVWPKRADAKYCSRACMAENYKGKWAGEDHPRYEKVTVECANCGEELKRKPCFLETYERSFCNSTCQGAWNSENATGKDANNWKGGYEEYYGSNWICQKRKALERDNYECRVCGKERDEIGKNPSVHHIKPIREFDEKENANKLSNLVCLCRKHHGAVEGWNLVPTNAMD